MNNNTDYTQQDLSRMRYYLVDMEEKFKKYPQSLALRNGIAHIRNVLGMERTVEPIDPFRYIDDLTEKAMLERKGR